MSLWYITCGRTGSKHRWPLYLRYRFNLTTINKLETAGHGKILSIFVDCLTWNFTFDQYASEMFHIYNILTWYLLGLNNLKMCWYFDCILCKCNRVSCFICGRKCSTLSHLGTLFQYFFNEVEAFLGTGFEDFLGISFFDSSCFTGFFCYLAFLFFIFFPGFLWLTTFLIYLLHFRIFLIPWFLKCNICFTIFHKFSFFILFCFSFYCLFWIIIILSFFSIQISLLLCWQFLLFNKYLMGLLAMKFYKLHLKVQGHWLSIVITWR